MLTPPSAKGIKWSTSYFAAVDMGTLLAAKTFFLPETCRHAAPIRNAVRAEIAPRQAGIDRSGRKLAVWGGRLRFGQSRKRHTKQYDRPALSVPPMPTRNPHYHWLFYSCNTTIIDFGRSKFRLIIALLGETEAQQTLRPAPSKAKCRHRGALCCG